MPRASTCGSANTSARLLIAPQGTFAASSAPSQSCLARVRSTSASIGTSVSRWRTRSAFFMKRGSVASSGTPATWQNFANWLSLPTARIRWPSATSNTWYGTMFWCALPARFGATPLAR